MVKKNKIILMSKFILKQIHLEKDNSLQDMTYKMSYIENGVVVEKTIPMIKDVSCDYTIKINVEGHHSTEKLEELWQAFSNVIERLNKGEKFNGFQIVVSQFKNIIPSNSKF